MQKKIQKTEKFWLRTPAEYYFDFSSADDCRVWLETTKDGVIYSKMAEKAEINEVSVVEITDIKTPEGGVEFDNEAKCDTKGIATGKPKVTYTVNNKAVTENKADWNTTYVASVTFAADTDNHYLFADEVAVKINGKPAEKVNRNEDGTITATCEMESAKKKVSGIASPTVPAENTFTSYYTQDNVLEAEELGRKTTVTYSDECSLCSKSRWNSGI